VRRLVKIILRRFGKWWRQKKIQKKTGWIKKQEEKKRGTGLNPNHGTGAQKWGKVTGFATGKCRIISNKDLEFWNLVDTYNPDIIIGTESWLREQIGNTEIFKADFTTSRRDRHVRGGAVFICIKNKYFLLGATG
jgi:hypothetical protein